jgi:hypothetical protein
VAGAVCGWPGRSGRPGTSHRGTNRASRPEEETATGPRTASTNTYPAANDPIRGSSPADSARAASTSENSPRHSTDSPMLAA